MRVEIENYVRSHAKEMYAECASIIGTQLSTLQNDLDKQIRDALEIFLQEIRKDYLDAVAGVPVSRNKMTNEDRQMRAELNQEVQKIFERFAVMAHTPAIDLIEGDGLNALQIQPVERRQSNVLAEQDADVWNDQAEDGAAHDKVGNAANNGPDIVSAVEVKTETE